LKCSGSGTPHEKSTAASLTAAVLGHVLLRQNNNHVVALRQNKRQQQEQEDAFWLRSVFLSLQQQYLADQHESVRRTSLAAL